MPKRVLIVDDSPSVRKMVLFLFASNGFSICGEAENGAEAIAKARQTRPDIIVLDYSMPVMDGIRAAKSLKQLMPRVPLLLFTVHDSSVLEKEAFAAGVSAIVSKEKASDLIIRARILLSARSRLKRMLAALARPQVAALHNDSLTGSTSQLIAEIHCNNGPQLHMFVHAGNPIIDSLPRPPG